VSSARRWIDALRLSISCELIDGWARTISMAANESRASRVENGKEGPVFFDGLETLLFYRRRNTLRSELR